MRYTSWQDVCARYPGAAKIATANDGENFELSFGRAAEASVDASLAVRYTVPLASTPSLAPDLVRDIATDLAYWKMVWMSLTAEQEKRLRDSIDERLSALACGSIQLVDSAGLVAASTGIWSTQQGYRNVTGIDPVNDWRVSSGELQDVEDSRDA